MKALGQWIALEKLVTEGGKLACQHILKYVSLIGNLADRRYRHEKMSQRLILPGHLDTAEQHKKTTYGHLNTAIREAGRGNARNAFVYFFNAFTTLDLPQFRGHVIEALFGNPAPLHKGTGVQDDRLWALDAVPRNPWKIVEREQQN
jgi:hypothetical protein